MEIFMNLNKPKIFHKKVPSTCTKKIEIFRNKRKGKIDYFKGIKSLFCHKFIREEG